jgi:hypothetical protein
MKTIGYTGDALNAGPGSGWGPIHRRHVEEHHGIEPSGR